MAKFVVEITRTETYVHNVLVKAKNEAEACRKARNYDDNNGFVSLWNELDPSVETEYEATDATSCDADSLEYMEEIR